MLKIMPSAKFMTQLVKKIFQDDCFGLASEMSYNLIFSLVPMTVFITSISGLIGRQKDVYPIMINFIQKVAPKNATNLFMDTIDVIVHSPSTQLTVVGFIGILWTAMNTGGIIIKGFQRFEINRDEKANFLPLSAISIFFIFSLLIVLSVYIVIIGDLVSSSILKFFRPDMITISWLSSVSWLIVLLGMFWSTTFIYKFFLKPKPSWIEAYKGSLFFVLSWVFISFALKLSLRTFPIINPLYGTLGAIIIFLMWLYYSSFVFFIGAEITSYCTQKDILSNCYRRDEAVVS